MIRKSGNRLVNVRVAPSLALVAESLGRCVLSDASGLST